MSLASLLRLWFKRRKVRNASGSSSVHERLTWSTGYLIESIPFLLGSGGTLAFDIMILMQSCIYRKGSTRRDHIRRRMKGIDAEGEGENDGLLANEEAGVDQEVTQDTDARTIRAASTRTRSTSLVRPRSTSVSNGWPAPTDNNPAADLR